MNIKQPPSLRSRYISLTLILGILVIGFVINVYLNLSEKNRQSTSTLAEIDANLNRLDTIRNDISTLYQSINLFILNPDDQEHIDQIHMTLNRAIEQSALFTSTQSPVIIDNYRQTLLKRLEKINPFIDQLITIRRDPNKQYPGMSLSANIMNDQQNAIKGLLDILNREIENGDFKPNYPGLYNEILQARILVEKEISQIRIYIANRLALFSGEILVNQAISLSEIHHSFLKKIDQFAKLYKNEPDSFEGMETIKKIRKTQLNWYNNFIILRELSESDHWREDSRLMETQITPLINQISTSLFDINQFLRQQKHQTTESFNENSQQLFYILSIIIGLFLLYIFMIQVSMEFLVFKPIHDIADVMKLKAFGHTSKQFSEKQSLETQNLVTAFIELENKVLSRTVNMKKAISKAKTAVTEAKIANEAKSTFLANMSHELRTPLHGILSFADLGSSKIDQVEKEKIKQYFDLIAESGQRLLLLLNDLLDLEKLESGRVEMNMTDNSLLSTTKSVIKQQDALIRQKELEVTITTGDIPETSVYDDEKITQVIQNLLSNAIKFSPQGGQISIHLDSEKLEDENMVRFVIEDDGIGIPEAELDSVFDKFIQSSKTQTGAGGTGLGLSICLEIIKAHHGLIKAETRAETGTRFIFCIPVLQKKTEEN